MFVRVFDRNKNTYFKSVVYSEVKVDRFSQCIVLNPITNTFELIDYFDESIKPAKALVETIQPDDSCFNIYEGSKVLKYKHFCKINEKEFVDLVWMAGYPDVCENNAFLAEILIKRSVPVEKYNISIREPEDVSELNYILTQADADDFMAKFVGFHDSTLEKIRACSHYSRCGSFEKIFRRTRREEGEYFMYLTDEQRSYAGN